MNASQRRSIANIAAQIESLRSLIENIVDDENDKYDSLPESFQDGEQGEKIQEGIDVLSSAVDNLQAAIDDLENLN